MKLDLPLEQCEQVKWNVKGNYPKYSNTISLHCTYPEIWTNFRHFLTENVLIFFLFLPEKFILWVLIRSAHNIFYSFIFLFFFFLFLFWEIRKLIHVFGYPCYLELWKCYLNDKHQTAVLALCMLGKKFSRWNFEIFFLIFPIKYRIWHIIQIVSLTWNFRSYFIGKVRKITSLSSAELVFSMISVRAILIWVFTICSGVLVLILRVNMETGLYISYLYNFDPLKPHFYIVKLGFTGIYIIFLISVQKHRLWVLIRTAW